MPDASSALITNDIVLLGLIAATLGAIFWAASGPVPCLRNSSPWPRCCWLLHPVISTHGAHRCHAHQAQPVARDVCCRRTGNADPVIACPHLKLGPNFCLVFCPALSA